MNTIDMPGFTAEASLYKTKSCYWIAAVWGGFGDRVEATQFMTEHRSGQPGWPIPKRGKFEFSICGPCVPYSSGGAGWQSCVSPDGGEYRLPCCVPDDLPCQPQPQQGPGLWQGRMNADCTVDWEPCSCTPRCGPCKLNPVQGRPGLWQRCTGSNCREYWNFCGFRLPRDWDWKPKGEVGVLLGSLVGVKP